MKSYIPSSWVLFQDQREKKEKELQTEIKSLVAKRGKLDRQLKDIEKEITQKKDALDKLYGNKI